MKGTPKLRRRGIELESAAGRKYRSIFVREETTLTREDLVEPSDSEWRERFSTDSYVESMEDHAAAILRTKGLPDSLRPVWVDSCGAWMEVGQGRPARGLRIATVDALAKTPKTVGFAAEILRHANNQRQALAINDARGARDAALRLSESWWRLMIRERGWDYLIARELTRKELQSCDRRKWDVHALHAEIAKYLHAHPMQSMSMRSAAKACWDWLTTEGKQPPIAFDTFRKDHFGPISRELGEN